MRYIGGKTKILPFIEKILHQNLDGDEQVFMDAFSGTGIVSRYFKKDYKIIANDFLYFSYVLLEATLQNNEPLEFKKLKQIGINNPIIYLQNYAGKKQGFISKNYTPLSKEGRMYFTEHNGLRIDYVRQTIQEWYDKNLIKRSEYFYLLAILIEAVPFISNTTGTYGAYLKHWDKRALNELVLRPLEVQYTSYENEVYNEDTLSLINKVSGDILYLDPPYNTRQYLPNYHLLETIARYDNPEIKGITGIRPYKNQKSLLSQKKNAFNALKDIIEAADFKHIILSYNTDGIIPEQDIVALLKENAIDNNVQINKVPYRKYKSKIVSKTDNTKELLFYIRKKESFKHIKLITNTQVNNQKNISGLTQPEFQWNPQQLIKSPLNYVGGKYKLLPQILPLFPNDISIFIDLFSGGGNVGINVESKKHYFNDINSKLNELFMCLQKNPIDIILKHIENRIEEFELSKTNQDGYLRFRNHYNSNPNPLDLYTLISFSYNYQLRFNSRHEYNNPFGKNRSSFSNNMKKNIIQFTNRLQTLNAEFTSFDFKEFPIEKLIEKNTFVYVDPPYLITTGSYNDGNRGFKNWTQKEEYELYNLLDTLNEKNIKFAFSNVLTHKGKTNKSLNEWSKKYNIHHLNYNYLNSSYNTTKQESDEVLITNY